MEQFERHSLRSSDGTAIVYFTAGDGPPMVVVHGGLIDQSANTRTLQLLAERYRVYAMDRRGHGESGPYPEDHRLEREYEDVEALFAVIAEPVRIVSHSSGARVSLHAAQRSGQATALVLYEPPLLGLTPPDLLARLHAQLAAGQTEEMVETALVDIVGGETLGGLTPETRERLKNGLQRSPTWDIVRNNARSLAAEFDSYSMYRFDPTPFRDFRVPSALFLGSRTPAFMRNAVQTLAADLPVSKVFLLEGEGHGAMSTSPELFVSTVYEALAWADSVRD